VYRVELKPRAQREFDRLSGGDQSRVLAALTALAEQPRARRCVKLTGSIYRLRVGPFRIIYAVFERDQLVLVGKIARREKDTYDDVDTLF